MQKVTPKPYAPPKTGGTGKSIRLFSLRFHFISNRHALPETGTGVTQKPAYSVFDSILLNIVRNICPLVKRKTLPAEHFVQKNKNKNEPSQALPRQLPRRGSQAVKFSAKALGAMRKFSAVLLPLPLRKDFPRSGGRCRAATKGGIWRVRD